LDVTATLTIPQLSSAYINVYVYSMGYSTECSGFSYNCGPAVEVLGLANVIQGCNCGYTPAYTMLNPGQLTVLADIGPTYPSPFGSEDYLQFAVGYTVSSLPEPGAGPLALVGLLGILAVLGFPYHWNQNVR
jgi:hypothetical protein